MMINCAMDYTYDLFVDDAKAYKATPIKGVYPSSQVSARERFMVYLKNTIRDFKNDNPVYLVKSYDPSMGYVGDVFAMMLDDINFSDMYKDAYGQRPHLDAWFYIHALDLPMFEDIARIFCAEPVKEAIMDAVENRLKLFS